MRRVRAWLDAQRTETQTDAAIIETAGGVHSPAPSGTSQADLLRPLRLPVVLVGSSQLGGISTTRAALESLRMRGYDVDAVLLFPSPYYGNDVYLKQLLHDELGIRVFAVGGPSGAGWGPPPVRAASDAEDVAQMHTYYRGLVHGRDGAETGAEAGLFAAVRHLRACHAARTAELESLAPRTLRQCWWPFTQHTRYAAHDVLAIDSAHGDTLAAFDGEALRPVLDGSASWWTQCVGHGHPRLASAAAYAAGRYGHVLFPGAANAPALELAERLLGRRPHAFAAPGAWADRVFFSDDGSTGMEVALKMALQASVRRYDPPPRTDATRARVARAREPGSLGGRPAREWQVLGLQGSYHGDTIGAMDACEPSIYSEHVAWYRGRGQWLAPPTLHVCDGRVEVHQPAAHGGARATYASLDAVYDVPHRLAHDALTHHYRASITAELERLVVVEQHRFGALLLEPLVMGAGGMRFVDPLFQRVLIDVVRAREDLFAMRDAPLRTPAAPRTEHAPGAWRGLPVVFDEVFTGLFRLGFASATEVLGTTPDIACYAKILSGGLVPLAVTLATHDIFAAFADSHEKAHALLHGHSYTAHPVGCAVANETLTLLDEMHRRGDWTPHQRAWGHIWSFWDRAFVTRLSQHPRVTSAMALGTVLKIELADAHGGYASDAAASLLARLRQHGVHLRPLGNVVYAMSSLSTPAEVLRETEAALLEQLE